MMSCYYWQQMNPCRRVQPRSNELRPLLSCFIVVVYSRVSNTFLGLPGSCNKLVVCFGEWRTELVTCILKVVEISQQERTQKMMRLSFARGAKHQPLKLTALTELRKSMEDPLVASHVR